MLYYEKVEWALKITYAIIYFAALFIAYELLKPVICNMHWWQIAFLPVFIFSGCFIAWFLCYMCYELWNSPFWMKQKHNPMEKSITVKRRKELMCRVAFLNAMIAGHATEDTAKSKLERSLSTSVCAVCRLFSTVRRIDNEHEALVLSDTYLTVGQLLMILHQQTDSLFDCVCSVRRFSQIVQRIYQNGVLTFQIMNARSFTCKLCLQFTNFR